MTLLDIIIVEKDNTTSSAIQCLFLRPLEITRTVLSGPHKVSLFLMDRGQTSNRTCQVLDEMSLMNNA